MIAYQKQNGLSRPFSPSLLVNYKSMGGCRRFAIVDTFSVCFSALIPLGFSVRAFCPFFLDAKVVFWSFSFFSLLLFQTADNF
jgi:hypothetical protein